MIEILLDQRGLKLLFIKSLIQIWSLNKMTSTFFAKVHLLSIICTFACHHSVTNGTIVWRGLLYFPESTKLNVCCLKDNRIFQSDYFGFFFEPHLQSLFIWYLKWPHISLLQSREERWSILWLILGKKTNFKHCLLRKITLFDISWLSGKALLLLRFTAVFTASGIGQHAS